MSLTDQPPEGQNANAGYQRRNRADRAETKKLSEVNSDAPLIALITATSTRKNKWKVTELFRPTHSVTSEVGDARADRCRKNGRDVTTREVTSSFIKIIFNLKINNR